MSDRAKVPNKDESRERACVCVCKTARLAMSCGIPSKYPPANVQQEQSNFQRNSMTADMCQNAGKNPSALVSRELRR